MKNIQTIVSVLLAFATCACGDEPKSGPAQALEDAKQGVAKAGAAFTEAWDKAVIDLSGKADEISREIDAAKPEMKSKLNELKATFDEQLAIAKQKFSEAKAAAPEQLEQLKKEAQAALAAAKQAYTDAISH